MDTALNSLLLHGSILLFCAFLFCMVSSGIRTAIFRWIKVQLKIYPQFKITHLEQLVSATVKNTSIAMGDHPDITITIIVSSKHLGEVTIIYKTRTDNRTFERIRISVPKMQVLEITRRSGAVEKIVLGKNHEVHMPTFQGPEKASLSRFMQFLYIHVNPELQSLAETPEWTPGSII